MAVQKDHVALAMAVLKRKYMSNLPFFCILNSLGPLAAAPAPGEDVTGMVDNDMQGGALHWDGAGATLPTTPTYLGRY